MATLRKTRKIVFALTASLAVAAGATVAVVLTLKPDQTGIANLKAAPEAEPKAPSGPDPEPSPGGDPDAPVEPDPGTPSEPEPSAPVEPVPDAPNEPEPAGPGQPEPNQPAEPEPTPGGDGAETKSSDGTDTTEESGPQAPAEPEKIIGMTKILPARPTVLNPPNNPQRGYQGAGSLLRFFRDEAARRTLASTEYRIVLENGNGSSTYALNARVSESLVRTGTALGLDGTAFAAARAAFVRRLVDAINGQNEANVVAWKDPSVTGVAPDARRHLIYLADGPYPDVDAASATSLFKNPFALDYYVNQGQYGFVPRRAVAAEGAAATNRYFQEARGPDELKNAMIDRYAADPGGLGEINYLRLLAGDLTLGWREIELDAALAFAFLTAERTAALVKRLAEAGGTIYLFGESFGMLAALDVLARRPEIVDDLSGVYLGRHRFRPTAEEKLLYRTRIGDATAAPTVLATFLQYGYDDLFVNTLTSGMTAARRQKFQETTAFAYGATAGNDAREAYTFVERELFANYGLTVFREEGPDRAAFWTDYLGMVLLLHARLREADYFYQDP